MEGLIQLCLGVFCIFTPILLVVLVGAIYAFGIGGIKLPGIGREEIHPGKEWTTVPDLSRKATEGIATIISLVGTMFGLIGFLLPWVKVKIEAGADLFNLDIGGLNGTLSGIALAFQSFVAGIGLFSVDIKGATGLALLFITISLLVGLIPVALVVSAGFGVGLISVPLGLIKAQIPRLARGLLIMSIISLCLTCSFFAGIQATVGGVKVGGSEGLFGTSMEIGVEVANGFWITVGGLILALIGAIVMNTLAGALSKWATNLVTLEREDVDVIEKPSKK